MRLAGGGSSLGSTFPWLSEKVIDPGWQRNKRTVFVEIAKETERERCGMSASCVDNIKREAS